MGLISRLWSLVRGAFSKQVRDLEWRSPEVVLEEASNLKRKRAGELLDALGKFRSAVERRRDRLKQMLLDLQQVEDRLAIAQDRRDMQAGPELMRRQRLLTDQIDADRRELESELKRRKELEQTLRATKDDIERFDIERHRMTAEIRALQAQRQAQEIYQQFYTETENIAVSAIRVRLQDERNRADLVSEVSGTALADFSSLDQEFDRRAFEAICDHSESFATPEFSRINSRQTVSMMEGRS